MAETEVPLILALRHACDLHLSLKWEIARERAGRERERGRARASVRVTGTMSRGPQRSPGSAANQFDTERTKEAAEGAGGGAGMEAITAPPMQMS